jgi:sirohydrochlorin cobaltochelatase
MIDDKKPVLLVVSFGTTFNDSRAKTIEAVEKALVAAYPEYELRRAFTSRIVIDKLAERDGLRVDDAAEAMRRLTADGVKNIVVQPTHVMNGREYDKMRKAILPFEKEFETVRYGLPLLISDADFEEIAGIITACSGGGDDTAVIFMGHGTDHESNAVYAKLDKMLKDRGFSRYFIATVESVPSLEDIVVQVDALNVKKIVLLPFMIVAGDHANNDMAGSGDDSWKSIFESKGYEVETVIKGLGEYPEIQAMFVRHAGEAINRRPAAGPE